MQEQGQPKQTILLMRHAQSTQNKRKKQMVKELKMGQNTEESTSKKSVQNNSLRNNPVYLEMSFAQQFLDAGLSELGFQQVMEANKILREKWGSDIGGVVVSPLKRALQTAEGVLKGIQNVHVWVQPLLSEAIHAACDIGSQIQSLIKIYGKQYDFSALTEQDWKNWSINMLQNSELRSQIQKQSLIQKRDANKIALQQMRAHKTLQTRAQTVKRCQKLKERLKIYESKIVKGKKLLIISHYFMIRYLTCTEYSQKQNGLPSNGIQLWNCQIMEIQRGKIFGKCA